MREFRIGEEALLRAVFFSSVHELASRDYSAAQLRAWAPRRYDHRHWARRMRSLRPFVAEVDGRVAGYADLQSSGYIHHFFVAGPHAGRGVGNALMAHLHAVARRRGIAELSADVSRAAEPFFARHGFVVERRGAVGMRGIAVHNARMRKRLASR